MNRDIMQAMAKLRQFYANGHMNRFEIEEVMEDLQRAESTESQQQISRMMDEVAEYLSTAMDEELQLKRYVRSHLDMVAVWLQRSRRTVYRKLQNDSFTLVEKKTIQQRMKQDAEGR